MMGQKLNVSLFDSMMVREQMSRAEMVRGLRKPKLFDWAPAEIDAQTALQYVKMNAPLASDVVRWMQDATANMIVLQTAADSYAMAGSEIAVGSGDGYIPGVNTTGIYGVSIPGGTMRSQGFGQCVIGSQVFNVPAGGKTALIGPNFLGWASIPSRGDGIQWMLCLMNWLSLAMSPVTSKIPFPSVTGDSATALVAPQFIMVSTKLPTPVHQLLLSIQSDVPQQMAVRGRSASNYATELFSLNIDVPAGESNYTIFVRGLPIVPPYVLHMQPQDGTQTAITSVSTRPM